MENGKKTKIHYHSTNNLKNKHDGNHHHHHHTHMYMNQKKIRTIFDMKNLKQNDKTVTLLIHI